jgi:NADH:ubiquinone oxidoreductase subunit 5 (subunit L)/multisubunit Na+/H+ antiporter MnhA subunit
MCFKAALFLCAGAVIHASEDQDMRRYGGLQLMPSAAIVASASLAGWPLLSGFYTKDGILEVSWTAVADVANTGMLIVVCLTSCYSFKLSFLADASAFSLPLVARRLRSACVGLLSLPQLYLPAPSRPQGRQLAPLWFFITRCLWDRRHRP